MIYAFDYPHKVQTVCGPGCPICDPEGTNENSYMTDQHGTKFPLQPLFIVREATFGEYLADLRSSGGATHPAITGHYYEVYTD